jgi:AraC-like DNA-binding protein
MARDNSVRFWQPASAASSDFMCAALETGCPGPHVHEEWQFAVVETTSWMSRGALGHVVVQPYEVAAMGPHEVHAERSGPAAPGNWRMLHVTAPIISRLSAEAASRLAAVGFRAPVITDPQAAAELGALLRRGEIGQRTETFEAAALDWVRRFLTRHAVEALLGTGHPAVDRARTYLRVRPTEPVTLREVREVAGVTVSYLVRSFARVVGLPPMSYHAKVRLAHACGLLAQGRPAGWVAYACAFADQSHLTRRFKETYGLTPGAFLAAHQGRRPIGSVEASAA